MDKKEIIKKVLDKNEYVICSYSRYWKYPETGDDQKTCPMLDFMFNVEHKKGYLIFIEGEEEKE